MEITFCVCLYFYGSYVISQQRGPSECDAIANNNRVEGIARFMIQWRWETWIAGNRTVEWGVYTRSEEENLTIMEYTQRMRIAD